MKWVGETTQQFWRRVTAWHHAYAFLPVQLETGEWIWFERYERRATAIAPTLLDIQWERRTSMAST